jgi:predicted MFS family arabinose efflux permease
MRNENFDVKEELTEKTIEPEGGLLESLSSILRSRNVVALCTARIAFASSFGVFSTIFPVYAKSSLGMTASTISFLFSVRGITNLATRMPAGRLSDRIGRKKPFVFAYILLIGVFVMLAYVKNFYLLLVVMALFGIGWGFRIAPSAALLSDSVESKDRPLALAFFMTMFDLGSIIGSLMVGYFASYVSPDTIMLFCAPIMVVAVMLFLVISRESKKETINTITIK